MKRKLIIGSIIAIVAIFLGVTIAGGAMGEKRIAKHMDLGNKYLEEENYEQAILAYEAVIKIDENSIEARTAMAKAYIGLNDMGQAETIAREAIAIDETQAEPWSVLIEIYEQTKTKPELAQLYQQAFEKTRNSEFNDWIQVHTPEKPEVNIASGEYEEAQQIEITNLKDGETIFYTLDGTEPDETKEKYDGCIKIIGGRVTVKLIVINEYNLSNSIEYTYEIIKFDKNIIDKLYNLTWYLDNEEEIHKLEFVETAPGGEFPTSICIHTYKPVLGNWNRSYCEVIEEEIDDFYCLLKLRVFKIEYNNENGNGAKDYDFVVTVKITNTRITVINAGGIETIWILED